jgi:hypothetical protein
VERGRHTNHIWGPFDLIFVHFDPIERAQNGTAHYSLGGGSGSFLGVLRTGSTLSILLRMFRRCAQPFSANLLFVCGEVAYFFNSAVKFDTTVTD